MVKKSLILFYSWSGNTRRIARGIAGCCLGCDVLPMLSVCGDGGKEAENVAGRWLNQIHRMMQMRKESTPIL